LQSDGTFILDAYVVSNNPNYSKWPMLNLTNIDLDIYQYVPSNYTNLLPALLQANFRSLGFYVWAYTRFSMGKSWTTMQEDYLTSVYDQGSACNASRVVIWNGFAPPAGDPAVDDACLYSYSHWWDMVRVQNLKFLGSTK
jgi:hypothetical protein